MTWRCIFCNDRFNSEAGLLNHTCEPQNLVCGVHVVSYVTDCFGRSFCPQCEAETARSEIEAEMGYERYLETRMVEDGELSVF